MVKYTHMVTILQGGVRGLKFKCTIIGGRVHCGEFTRPDGTVCGGTEVYEHNSDIENLTPELWFGDPQWWSVEKLNQFKGNK